MEMQCNAIVSRKQKNKNIAFLFLVYSLLTGGGGIRKFTTVDGKSHAVQRQWNDMDAHTLTYNSMLDAV